MRCVHWLCIAWLAASCVACAPLTLWQVDSETVAPGVVYWKSAPFPASVVHVVRIDLQQPGLQLSVSPPDERGRTAEQFRAFGEAIVSINASFFDKTFVPRGITVSDGQRWLPVLLPAQSPFFSCTKSLHCQIQHRPPYAMDDEMMNAVAGTPSLVQGGQVRSEQDDQTCPYLCANRHPRTAVGIDVAGQYLYLVTAEGRHPPVLGLTLAELAGYLKHLGVAEAINLDGGGSSTLVIKGRQLMARPANEIPLRNVANLLSIRIATAN